MELGLLLMSSVGSSSSDGYESMKRPLFLTLKELALAQGLSLIVFFSFSFRSSTFTQLPPSITLTLNNLPLQKLIIRTSDDV